MFYNIILLSYECRVLGYMRDKDYGIDGEKRASVHL